MQVNSVGSNQGRPNPNLYPPQQGYLNMPPNQRMPGPNPQMGPQGNNDPNSNQLINPGLNPNMRGGPPDQNPNAPNTN
jgi:hypothetical protein